MKNSKLLNKIIIMTFSLALASIFVACRAEMVELKEAIKESTATAESAKEETTIVSATEEFNPVIERDKTLEVAGINKAIVDISDVENGRVYQEIKYAKLNTSDIKIQKILDTVNNNIKKSAEDFKTENKEYVREDSKNSERSDYKYSYDSTDVVVTEKSDKYLSLRMFTYIDMMGAHPSYYITGYIFDVNNGKRLEVMDIVKDKETLRNFFYDWCDKNRDSVGLFDEYKITIDGYVNGEYELQCYMEGGETYAVFQTYDIAPYAAGAIHVKLPVEILK